MTLTQTIDAALETGQIITNIMADETMTKQEKRELVDVILNEAEQRLVEYVSKKRYAANRATNATATIYNDADAIENEMDSFGAEVAYCKVMNCFPDLDTTHRPPFDAKLQGGRTVDVKQTKYATGVLMVKQIERAAHPDLYALMVGRFPKYQLRGHMTAREILTPNRLQADKWKHPAYVAQQSELK